MDLRPLCPALPPLHALAAEVHEGLGHGREPGPIQLGQADPPEFAGKFAAVERTEAALLVRQLQQSGNQGETAVVAGAFIAWAGVAEAHQNACIFHERVPLNG